MAEGERYRVEVLVLKHIQGAQDPDEVNRITDYSSALDFLTPVEVEEFVLPEGCEVPLEEPEPATDPATSTLELDEIGGTGPGDLAETELGEPAEEETGAEPEVDPNAVVHITEMGAEMQDAWRRLRLSGPYRPLQFLAWEQGSEAPFPELRLHNLEVVLVDDPYADLREVEEYQEVFEYGDTLDKDNADDPIPPECEPPEEDPLPDPFIHYSLDGTVSLVRTRFLHLNLDLQLREALFETEADKERNTALALLPGQEADTPGLAKPSAFLVHGLEQSRQVRSSRMEYFDGPVIGVLAWITTIPLEDDTER